MLGGKRLLLTKWKGKPRSTWEPVGNFVHRYLGMMAQYVKIKGWRLTYGVNSSPGQRCKAKPGRGKGRGEGIRMRPRGPPPVEVEAVKMRTVLR